MTIITPTGVTGINSITASGNSLSFQNASGASIDVSGLKVAADSMNVSGIVTASGGFIGNVTGNLNSSGVSTFTNGPILIGSGTSTGTSSQRLQITGNAYVSGSLGIGTTNSGTKIEIVGGWSNNTEGSSALRITANDTVGAAIALKNAGGKYWNIYNGGSSSWVGDGNLGFVYSDGVNAASAAKVGFNSNGNVLLNSGSLQTNSIVPLGGLQSGVTAGGVIQFQHYTNSTRTSLSNASSFALWSVGNFVKASANSVLYIRGQLVFADGESYNMGPYWKIGASGNRYDGIIFTHYDSDAGSTSAIKVSWHIDGYYDTTSTGSQAIEIGWSTANGGSDRPGLTWNPNATDDARSRQFSSDVTIFEIGK